MVRNPAPLRPVKLVRAAKRGSIASPDRLIVHVDT